MPLPELAPEGFLPPGIHPATFVEVESRFGAGSEARERQTRLLREVRDAARRYATVKRILVWGSYVTAKSEPNDLDYSIVVSVGHERAPIAPEHRRFFIPYEAKQYYGVDRGYLVIRDYPLETYVELLDFLCHTRVGHACGIVEIQVRGEFAGEPG